MVVDPERGIIKAREYGSITFVKCHFIPPYSYKIRVSYESNNIIHYCIVKLRTQQEVTFDEIPSLICSKFKYISHTGVHNKRCTNCLGARSKRNSHNYCKTCYIAYKDRIPDMRYLELCSIFG